MDTGLAGKAVVVTGSTANIGKGILLAFAEEGCRVVVVGRDEIAGQRVVDEALRRGAPEALWRRTDVVDRVDAAGLISDTLERLGAIDVLVNNVGGNTAVSPFVDSTIDQWRYDIDLTLMSTLNCTHAVLPHMLGRGEGRIINIGSMSALIGDRFMAVYSAAKGAVHSFTKVLALEVGKSGITVNAIAPYGTMPEDPFNDTSTGSRFQPETGLFPRELVAQPELVGLIARDTALTRPHAKPSEIGAAAVYLASQKAAFVTGQVLQVDGGVQLP
ncbi:MAG: SDR family NAD(P)-dependent oxidoreductase [Acidimicrobiia bacterium]